MTEEEVRIPAGDATLAGTLGRPAHPDAPGVLLLGGTFSDLRDGDPDPAVHPGIPPHGMYRLLAHALVAAGWTVLRFDRRGSGGSTGRPPGRRTEEADALAAWRFLLGQVADPTRLAVIGESAGAYVACRIAGMGAQPMAAVLQGALASPIETLVLMNAQRARRFWERGPDERAWLRANAGGAYRAAVVAPTLGAALAGGRAEVVADDEGAPLVYPLAGLAEDQDAPPIDQFRHLRCPVLVLHAADDLNVEVDDAFRTARALWQAGNRAVEVHIVPGADHSFQVTPPDADERLRERLSFASFRRPFHAAYPGVIVTYLDGIRGS